MNPKSTFIESDFSGENYQVILKRLHDVLLPKSYFEIGVAMGRTFRLAQCASIGVDPKFKLRDIAIVQEIIDKPVVQFFQMGSDEFFRDFSPTQLLGREIDLAFLDGLHHCEYLLRDFMNTERFCRNESVVILHDCLPLDLGMTSREQGVTRSPLPHRQQWWAGDVWRTCLVLKRRRSDLSIIAIDAPPTGLVLITNLDPTSTAIADSYQNYVDEMLSLDLAEIGIEQYFSEINVLPTSVLATSEDIERLLNFSTCSRLTQA